MKCEYISGYCVTLELKDEILDKGVGLASESNIEYGNRFQYNQTLQLFAFAAILNWQPSLWDR